MNLKEMRRGIWKVLEEGKGKEKRNVISKVKLKKEGKTQLKIITYFIYLQPFEKLHMLVIKLFKINLFIGIFLLNFIQCFIFFMSSYCFIYT